MTIRLAEKTLAAIKTAIELDNGAKFKKYEQECLPQCTDAYSQDELPFRNHLGASLIGGPCDRALWYGFRWAVEPTPGAQMLRLWNRGHLEEGRFIALLKTIGCTVYTLDDDGKQFRIESGVPHFGGSCDCVFKKCPDLDYIEPVLGEFKTHNEKSFKKLQSEGVKKSKWEHYVQMQIYLHCFNLRYALYMAVNKNTDELYAEIIEVDLETPNKYLDRAKAIIAADKPPKRVSDSAGWWQCQWCNYYEVCHENTSPKKTCRTCAKCEISTTTPNVYCSLKKAKKDYEPLTPMQQYVACTSYKGIL